ncbi:hypothetical protein BHYA_0064g00030 [Botrytis hyacinthi]|uniref:Uncharacterized protein n=1 Tax=Botrytis hyacinthi TaxID=278943 RepID=A0A4Z1H050_9HELO|nr:hypothetical protein BHYA_0064g00030 [Botrytis hyacinthi]
MDLAEAVFDGSQIEDALRSMQSGKHAGKFFISFGEDTPIPVMPQAKFTGILDSRAKYIIAGGLG